MAHIKPVSKASGWSDSGDIISIITALLSALGPIFTSIAQAISNSKSQS